MKLLPNSLFLFIFPSPQEAARVLREGSKELGNFKLLLDVWVPKASCSGYINEDEGACIRVFGLPVHLWRVSVLKSIGDLCGGYIRSDAADSSSIEWARILVNYPKSAPGEILINDGLRCFHLKVWKEELAIVNLEGRCKNEQDAAFSDFARRRGPFPFPTNKESLGTKQNHSLINERQVAHNTSPIQPRQRLVGCGMRIGGSEDWVVVAKKNKIGRHIQR